MATNAVAVQKALNAAIVASLRSDTNIYGLVYISYDNKDLGIQEDNMPVHA